LGDVHGTGRDDVWAVGLGDVLHWDGQSWSVNARFGDEATFAGVWASGPTDVWAVASDPTSGGGSIRHWDGTAWTVALRIDAGGLSDVWGSAPNDVWVVGAGGSIFQWDGNAWTPLT